MGQENGEETASKKNTSRLGVGIHDIAFYVALFFIIGIAGASVGISVWLTILSAIALGLSGGLFKRKFALVFAAIAFLGFFYFNFHAVVQEENFPLGEKITLEGVVHKQPQHGFKSQEIDLNLEEPMKGTVRVYTSTLPRFEYGDVLKIDGVIEKSPSGRLNIVSFPKIEKIGEAESGKVRSYLYSFKDKMVENLNAVLPPEHSSLASGILFGERAEFREEFEDAMRKSGTTHIVALSGYNVAIIGITLSTVLTYVMRRKYAFYASLGAIPAFVVMTGAEASVVRAGIMGIILLLAERQSRIYSFRNAITLTAFVMLLFNPRLLVFDTGFQLSFMALIGIVYIYPIFKKRFGINENEGVFGWKRNLFQTLSAQLAVAPIILATFGYMSPTALIANVLILEFIPITMLLTFLTATFGFMSFGLSLILGWITSVFLGYEIFIINLFSLNWL